MQHLNPLLTLPTFTALWLTILDFMDKYMHIGKRDLLVGSAIYENSTTVAGCFPQLNLFEMFIL